MLTLVNGLLSEKMTRVVPLTVITGTWTDTSVLDFFSDPMGDLLEVLLGGENGNGSPLSGCSCFLGRHNCSNCETIILNIFFLANVTNWT